MKYCPKCGAQNADNEVNCVNCGEQLFVQQAAPQPPVYQQPVYQQPVYQQPYKRPPVPGNGLGIASMVVGIVSLALFCTGWLAIICSIVGIALGAISINKAKQAGMKNGMAVAGLVCSIVSLGILLILVISGVSAVTSIASMF